MLKLIFYVPKSHVEAVKAAIFTEGAGRIGGYEHCCWQTLGQGQFTPMENSQPYTGVQNVITTVDEYKVECVLEDELIVAVIAALLDAHPYEEPAYQVVKLLDF